MNYTRTGNNAVSIYVDASVRASNLHHSGMAYAWVAVDDMGNILQVHADFISAEQNPTFDNNIAEGLALIAAYTETCHYSNRQFFSDSQTMVNQVQTPSKPCSYAIIQKIAMSLRHIKLQFAHKNAYSYLVDLNAKSYLRGHKLCNKPNPTHTIPTHIATPTTSTGTEQPGIFRPHYVYHFSNRCRMSAHLYVARPKKFSWDSTVGCLIDQS